MRSYPTYWWCPAAFSGRTIVCCFEGNCRGTSNAPKNKRGVRVLQQGGGLGSSLSRDVSHQFCCSVSSKSQINFVNAVLRSIDREGQEALEATSVYDNVEPWLVQNWIDSYGDENTKAIVEAAMAQSPIFISVNHEPQSTAAEREVKLERIREEFSTEEGLEAELLPHGCIRVPEQSFGSVSTWPGYEEGHWWVQDPSATLPALALFNSLTKEGNGVEDLRVVDLCSAPGGKTAQLCSLGFGKVTAVEVSARRTKPLNENLARLHMKELCQVVVADGRDWKPEDNAKVDGVLVDAPCSATGVGSRRPDVLRKSPELEELTRIQKELAVHTVDELLDIGGIMVYATCSLLKEESEDQMNWLLSRNEGAEVETIPFLPDEIPGFDDAIDKNGWLRVIPGVLPGTLKFCDGFFVARLRRTR
jgi:16S rRNA (cytosine967-C5)-methyltransferase